MKTTLILLLMGIVSNSLSAQSEGPANTGRINIYLITKESKKISTVERYIILRARLRSIFHSKLRVIVAMSSDEAATKIEKLLNRKKKILGNIWFDSHGHYVNRYSSFHIGVDEFSYKTINHEQAIVNLKRIAKYANEDTKVAVGSCYAGAAYYFPATDSTPASRMNGDSLMIGLGNIFRDSRIFASESWVMNKPGGFSNEYAFAGYPLGKKFFDVVYEPVWERIGLWKEFSTRDRIIHDITTVSLDKKGRIAVRNKNYNELSKTKAKIAKVKSRLKPGLAKFS